MEKWIPIISMLISGAFGLLVAWVTWKLASNREKRKFKQEVELRDFKEIETLYSHSIALLDKIIKLTRDGGEYSKHYDEITLITARISILGSEKINKYFHIASQTLAVWTTLYLRGRPKKIGDTGFRMVTSDDIKTNDDAEKIYEELLKDIREYIQTVKDELKSKKLLLKM